MDVILFPIILSDVFSTNWLESCGSCVCVRWSKMNNTEQQTCDLHIFECLQQSDVTKSDSPLGNGPSCSRGWHIVLFWSPSHLHLSAQDTQQTFTHTHTRVYTLYEVYLVRLCFSPSLSGRIWADQSWGPGLDRRRTSPSHCSVPPPSPPVHHLHTHIFYFKSCKNPKVFKSTCLNST